MTPGSLSLVEFFRALVSASSLFSGPPSAPIQRRPPPFQECSRLLHWRRPDERQPLKPLAQGDRWIFRTWDQKKFNLGRVLILFFGLSWIVPLQRKRIGNGLTTTTERQECYTCSVGKEFAQGGYPPGNSIERTQCSSFCCCTTDRSMGCGFKATIPGEEPYDCSGRT